MAALASALTSALLPSVGVLQPPFDPSVAEYAVTVGNGVTSIRLTPTTNASSATVAVSEETLWMLGEPDLIVRTPPARSLAMAMRRLL